MTPVGVTRGHDLIGDNHLHGSVIGVTTFVCFCGNSRAERSPDGGTDYGAFAISYFGADRTTNRTTDTAAYGRVFCVDVVRQTGGRCQGK
jgi:hypothetical protein